MIDTHSHLDFDEYQNNFDEELENIRKNDVQKVIIPGVRPLDFDRIVNLCEKYDMLYFALGVHPSEFQTWDDNTQEKLKMLLNHKKAVAVGEIGLDYHYDPQTKEEQKFIFKKQLEIAQDLKCPVLIHDREAHEDCFSILQDYKLKDVIFHCFSGSKDFALKCLDKGYYIALGGVVTFKNAGELKETAKIIPLERLLLETDSPYLAPVPYRGKVNTSAYLKYIAQEIADIKGIDVSEVKSITTENAKKIFGI